MKSASRRRRGTILIEASIAISIFAGFIVIASHLVAQTLRVASDASESATTLSHFSAAEDRLRADAWGASDFDVERAGTAVGMGMADGSTVRWSVGEDGTLTRVESRADNADGNVAGGAAHWPRVLPGATFSTDGGMLVLTVARTADARRLEFPSQLLLLRRAQGSGQ